MIPNSGSTLFGSPSSFGSAGSNNVQDQNRLMAAVADAQVNRFYSRVPLPNNLQGYVRYVVVLDPQDSKPYSIGIKYVCRSKGADEVLTRLSENVNRRHKKRVHAWLCKCCPSSSICPAEWNCPDIHVTPVGYSNRRPWTQALGPNPRKTDGSRGEDEDSWSDEDRNSDQPRKPRPVGSTSFVTNTIEEDIPCKAALEQFPDLANYLPNFAHFAARFNDDPDGIDPNLLKSVSTAASSESSQLATQLACLNVDLHHMAQVSHELRFSSAPFHPPATPASNMGPIGQPVTSPVASPHPVTPIQLWGQPFDLNDLMGRVEPSAADITQNIISILTNLNVITLLNQIACTLTDPAQLLLINQLASQITTQITGRVADASQAASDQPGALPPAQLPSNVSSLLPTHFFAGPHGPAGPTLPPTTAAAMARDPNPSPLSPQPHAPIAAPTPNSPPSPLPLDLFQEQIWDLAGLAATSMLPPPLPDFGRDLGPGPMNNGAAHPPGAATTTDVPKE
eukprot:GGOE01004107.1.p1 GENE.GGOE01004107.1~~GGOE01004107.1.p1  ORF type:complete len:517 (-),score=54.49 GGOE01004107.1:885-2408(-)